MDSAPRVHRTFSDPYRQFMLEETLDAFIRAFARQDAARRRSRIASSGERQRAWPPMPRQTRRPVPRPVRRAFAPEFVALFERRA